MNPLPPLPTRPPASNISSFNCVHKDHATHYLAHLLLSPLHIKRIQSQVNVIPKVLEIKLTVAVYFTEPIAIN